MTGRGLPGAGIPSTSIAGMSHRPLTSTTRLGAIELALADYEALFGHPLVDECPIDPLTGEL